MNNTYLHMLFFGQFTNFIFKLLCKFCLLSEIW